MTERLEKNRQAWRNPLLAVLTVSALLLAVTCISWVLTGSI